jgi:hypothetical protein
VVSDRVSGTGEPFNQMRIDGLDNTQASCLEDFSDVDCGQLGILDLQLIVNVCFRQSLLKYSDYSGKLIFFDKNDCSEPFQGSLLASKLALR